MKNIKLPTKITPSPHNPPFNIATTIDAIIGTPLMCVGANGSGKSAFGAWIDSSNPNTYRISAQRAISMNEEIAPQPVKTAERNFHRRHTTQDVFNERLYQPQKDFEPLLQVLLAEKRQRDAEFVQEHKEADNQDRAKLTPKLTKIDILQKIWEQILPHRKLIFGDGRVEVKSANAADNNIKYSAKRMSDGERVTFYLIGQCLCAPKNSIIIIDEPEIHIHKAIRDPLWSRIEHARSDCTFIYLTHDVDFAASRPGATLIWIRSFDGVNWEWEELDRTGDVPEQVRLELLGSRNPVLFVEGSAESYDVAIYSAVYPELTVTPLGSCETVIRTVQGFSTLEDFHHYQPRGIIDRDYRCKSEIDSLIKNGIHILDVAEIEHLFCLPEILTQLATDLHFDPADKINKSTEFVLSEFESEREIQIARRAEREIKYILSSLDLSGAKNQDELNEKFQLTLSKIDTSAIYEKSKSVIDSIIESKNYMETLRVFNRKGLARQLRHTFEGTCPISFISRAIRQGNGENYLAVLRDCLPSVEELFDYTIENIGRKTTGLNEKSCI
ncbi:DUF4435 domain-containing protein [Lujinxingia sediminis]|uniref:DUF4435 domain-containing protein n=1 Tax=Lujinxingia sediminis TaxID=2480984 RepID=A0ABY0CUU2_9DELT|nr:DUF4435 domain-containing protein [Lujinxingia sediminis]RVU46678.1 DUF4435 domain-containing protein [Lujinxingia sediminis]